MLREYDANLVELLKVVTYGVDVGGNDADDVTKGQDNEHHQNDSEISPYPKRLRKANRWQR